MKLVGEDHSRAKVVLEVAAAAALAAAARKVNQVKNDGDRIEHTSYLEASRSVIVDIIRGIGEKATRVAGNIEFDESGQPIVVGDIEAPYALEPHEIDDLETLQWPQPPNC